jgi:hypothetical protein
VEKNIEVIINISMRLFHVNLFLQIPMYEGGFNIYLLDLPFILGGKGYNKVDGIHFRYGGKRSIIVNPFNLRNYFGN